MKALGYPIHEPLQVQQIMNTNHSWISWKNKINTYLLERENVLVDVTLQSLISVVDTQLLKAVCLEVLKSKHIQDTDRQTLKTTNKTIQNLRTCSENIIWLILFCFFCTYFPIWTTKVLPFYSIDDTITIWIYKKIPIGKNVLSQNHAACFFRRTIIWPSPIWQKT